MATQLTIPAAALVVTPTANASDATGNFVSIAAGVQRVVLRFANTSGGAITVTLDDPNTGSPESAAQFNPDVAVVVPATNGVRYVVLAGARLARFKDKTTSRVNWTPSAATGLAVEIVQV